jgi:hypothetical protein
LTAKNAGADETGRASFAAGLFLGYAHGDKSGVLLGMNLAAAGSGGEPRLGCGPFLQATFTTLPRITLGVFGGIQSSDGVEAVVELGPTFALDQRVGLHLGLVGGSFANAFFREQLFLNQHEMGIGLQTGPFFGFEPNSSTTQSEIPGPTSRSHGSFRRHALR